MKFYKNLIFAAVSILMGCSPFGTPQFRMPSTLDVEVLKWDGSSPTILTKAVCYNQNNMGFEFQGGEVTIKLDTLTLGTAKIDTSFHVSARSEFIVPARLKIDLVYLTEHGLQLDSPTVNLDGQFKGKIAAFTKTLDIHYKAQHKIHLIMEPF